MNERKPTKPYRPYDIIICRPFGFRIPVDVHRCHDLFSAAQKEADRKGRERKAKGLIPRPIHKLAVFKKSLKYRGVLREAQS